MIRWTSSSACSTSVPVTSADSSLSDGNEASAYELKTRRSGRTLMGTGRSRKCCGELGGVLVGGDLGHLGLGGLLDGRGVDPGEGLRPAGLRVPVGQVDQVALHAVAVAGLL